MEDWALIRRLAAEGVPKARIAKKLGVSRTTVLRAIASDTPPKPGEWSKGARPRGRLAAGRRRRCDIACDLHRAETDSLGETMWHDVDS